MTSEGGFELGEHPQWKQLLFFFASQPDLKIAEELETMGFEHTMDERLFIHDANAVNRRKAMKVAKKLGGHEQERSV